MADLLNRLGSILEEERKAEIKGEGGSVLSEADKKVAIKEAIELADALNADDKGGGITRMWKSDPKCKANVINAVKNFLKNPASAAITGETWEQPHPKARPRRVPGTGSRFRPGGLLGGAGEAFSWIDLLIMQIPTAACYASITCVWVGDKPYAPNDPRLRM